MADRNKAPLWPMPSPLEISLPQPDSSSDLGLHSAVSRGDIGSICYALLGGQPIGSLHQGLQPIHLAAIHGDVAIVEFLLHNGADLNAQTTVLPSPPPDPNSHTPEKAPEKKDTRHQRSTKSRGSFSFLKTSAAAAVDSSVISGPMGTVPGLHSMSTASCDLPCVSDADCMDDYSGATPLHFAVANGHTACADALLRRGARVDIADSYGNTPETLAATCACDAMLDVFGHWYQYGPTDNEFWIQAAAEVAAQKGANHLPLQLPSPDPSVTHFADSPHALEPRNHMHGDGENSLPVQCRIARSATSPLPGQNVSATSSTANPCKGPNDPRNILSRRHTAGETSMGKRQSQESMLSASSNSSWCLVDNKSALPANNYPSSSAPGRIVREQSSFYQVRADSVVQPPTGNPTRKRRLAPGRIMCISERQCVSASASRSNSTASRRERSHTDTVINQAWRKYLEFDDESARDSAQCIATSDDSAENASQPLPELWMWRQAAIAVRNRRSKSLSAQQQQQLYQKQKPL